MLKRYCPWLTWLPASMRLWKESKSDFKKQLAKAGKFKDFEKYLCTSLCNFKGCFKMVSSHLYQKVYE